MGTREQLQLKKAGLYSQGLGFDKGEGRRRRETERRQPLAGAGRGAREKRRKIGP